MIRMPPFPVREYDHSRALLTDDPCDFQAVFPSIFHASIGNIENLPPAMRDKAEALIARLDNEPVLGKRLVGPLKGIRAARLGRSHRVLFEMNDDGTAHILTVVQRRDAYR